MDHTKTFCGPFVWSFLLYDRDMGDTLKIYMRGEKVMAEYASRGVGTAGLTTGIIGTAGWLLNGGLGNILGGGAVAAENMPISRYEADMMDNLSSKDSEISLLKSERYTDERLVDVYKDLQGQINAFKAEQNAVNMQQVAYNATNSATIACVQNQVNQLLSLTKLVVPNTSVCPGWGEVKVTPATTTTTTPTA